MFPAGVKEGPCSKESRSFRLAECTASSVDEGRIVPRATRDFESKKSKARFSPKVLMGDIASVGSAWTAPITGEFILTTELRVSLTDVSTLGRASTNPGYGILSAHAGAAAIRIAAQSSTVGLSFI